MVAVICFNKRFDGLSFSELSPSNLLAFFLPISQDPNENTMIKAIITDLGNVLVKFDHMAACRKLAKFTSNGMFNAGSIYEKIIRDPIVIKYEKGLISSPDFCANVSRCLELQIDYETFSQAWAEIFEAIPEMEEMLADLKNQLPVYLISNTNEIHFQYVFKQFPIVQQLNGYVLSYKIGHMKPEMEIYQEVLRHSGLSAHECLYIDDIKRYVEAASALGFHCIHFIDPQQFKEKLRSFGLSLL